MSTLTHPLQHISGKGIMTDASEDHKGTVSIGGRTIINHSFADDIDGLAGQEEELAKFSGASRQSLHNLWHGDQCREDQADDKQHQWHQHRDKSKWTEV